MSMPAAMEDGRPRGSGAEMELFEGLGALMDEAIAASASSQLESPPRAEEGAHDIPCDVEADDVAG